MDITKGLHVLFGSSVLGAVCIFYVYILAAVRMRSFVFLKQVIRYSFWADFIALFVFFGAFLSGTWLVYLKHYHFSTDWIRAAYLLLVLISICWCLSIWVKCKNYRALRQGAYEAFQLQWVFHLAHFLIFVFFVLIIHDAVTKSIFF